MFHGIQRILSDIAGHHWACGIVKQAQRVVTHFQCSHRPKSLLDNTRHRVRVEGASLETANKTRLTSEYSMLVSTVRNARALCQLGHDPNFTDLGQPSRMMADIVSQDSFYTEVALLVKIIKLGAEVVMAVQGADTTLADVTRYWIYLAQELWNIVDGEFAEEGGEHSIAI
jgi:hypothetical protein